MKHTMKALRACTASLVSCALALAMPAGALAVSDAVTAPAGYVAALDGAAQAATTWEVGAENAASVTATFDAAEGSLTLALAAGVTSAAMADYASAAEVPWAPVAASIHTLVLPEGLTNLGAHAFAGLGGSEGLGVVRAPSTVTAIGANALADSGLCAFDLSACTGLAAIETGALCQEAEGLTVYVAGSDAAALVTSATGAAGAWEGGTANPATTAVAVTNGAAFADDAVFAAGELCTQLELDGYDFVCWCTDTALMHPASEWKPISQHVTYYAKTRAWDTVTSPVEYPGYQGFDQQVLLCDTSQLPKKVVKEPGVTYYGETATCFDNRFDEPLNGNKDIVFAFTIARGSNTNGGDGSYLLSYTMDHITVLDAEGNCVAAYEGGEGSLKLVKMIFENDESKTSGNFVTAIKFGLDARTLEAGTYTLRFGAEIGANNGLSFLGKNVDFQFEVDRPEEYRLSYSADGKSVTGIAKGEGIDYAVDVVVPQDVTAIEAGTFDGADYVRSVTLPAAVATIGERAFANMPALEWVKSLSASGDMPVFGADVFSGSGVEEGCVLYGYTAAATVREAAELYDNVTFMPIDDGIYVDGALVEKGAAVELTKESPSAAVRVFAGGEDITAACKGYLTNTNVAAHISPAGGEWQRVTAKADGTCALEIVAEDGTEIGSVQFTSSGFDAAGGTEQQAVTAGQGNGCTIRLTGVGAKNADPKVTVRQYDERSTAFYDDYLGIKVEAGAAQFTFTLAGPGNAWGIDRWDWDDWTSNHLNPHISLVDGNGKTVATVGKGLYWIKLTDSNEITLGVEPTVMTPGKTYTLIAGEGLTGHNVAASLLKEVHWTFTAKASSIKTCSIKPIPKQKYKKGKAIKPKVTVRYTIPACSLWSTEKGAVVTKAAAKKVLASSAYKVSYSNNKKAGKATVTVKGKSGAAFTGTLKATFKIAKA